ncbi:MAG: hypothetical protein V2I65_16120 [Paracoccaceae bacterium]|jgi:hypothetical protein|nr:hypothetical protein [Paracoccaceae bacterium]
MEFDIDTLASAAAAFAATFTYLTARASLKARISSRPRLQESTARNR